MKSSVFLGYMLAFCFAVIGLSACSERKKAGETAMSYFQMRIDGDAEGYAKGHLGYDSIPESVQSQLVDLVRMTIYTDSVERGGIKSVRVVSEALDGDSVANVQLQATYVDGTVEDVLMPLVRVDDRWLMP